jgi:Na+-driven multidrug efflux pump
MSTTDGAVVDGFEDYLPTTTETPVGVVVAIGVLVFMAFAYILFYVFCLPSWNNMKNGELENLVGGSNETQGNATDGTAPDHEMPSDGTGTNSDLGNHDIISGGSQLSARQSQRQQQQEEVAALIPDAQPSAIHSLEEAGLQVPSTDRSSAVASTTSSSRLRQRSVSDRPLRSWDLSSMRWSHRGPLQRAQSIRRSVQAERQVHVSSEEGSHASRSRSSWNSRPGGREPSHRGISDVASNILDEGNVEGEAQFYRQRYIDRNRSRRRRGPASLVSSSARSIMPALSPDAISPDDAADAHDPGTANTGYGYDFGDDDGGDCLNCCSPVGNLLDYSDLDFETRRIVALAFPSTIEAATDPFFRIGMLAIISHFLDTNSMVAFLLVSLLLRITTEEFSGALADAQSHLLQDAIAQGGNLGFTLAGRFVQLGILMQLFFTIPILVVWSIFMEDVMVWLVSENPEMAQVASKYVQVIAIEFAIKAASRAFMLVFHLTGQAQFELNVDLSMTALTIVVVSITGSVTDDISLTTVGWIQVAISFATALGKVTYIASKGFLKPYLEGMFGGISLFDTQKVSLYVAVSLPLLLGSLVEIREWEILTFIVQKLGGAETVAWAMMGIVWEVFEAFTEGLGEASAVRISYYLSDNLPDMAEQLANKAVFLSMIESTILTSIFLMVGPNLSVALTRDSALQNLFDDLVAMVALAGFTMSLAQVFWSITGAQGYFGRASGVILAIRWLVKIPLGFIFIYGAFYDLNSIAGCVAAGYAIAAGVLSRSVFRTDWKQVAAEASEDLAEADRGLGMESEEEMDMSEDDSSTGFG